MIGILTQYGRNETTIAAIRLADLALAQGRQVSLVATSVLENDVHPYWDGQVRSSRQDGVYRWLRGCSSVVHFDVSADALRRVSLVAEHAQQILVPRWHSLQWRDLKVLRQYAVVVCPSAACYHALTTLLDVSAPGASADHSAAPRLTWCRWIAGLPQLVKDGTVAPGRLRVCFYCDAAAIDSSGSLVLGVVDELLGALSQLDVTLLSVKSWPRGGRRLLKQLARRWPRRLACKQAGNLVRQVREFGAHDWVVLPGVRADFAVNVFRAMACGTPVIAYRVAPFDESICTGHDGRLVPCAVRAGACGALTAVADAAALAAACVEAFGDEQHLLELQRRDWRLTHKQQAFDDFWQEIWG